MKDNFSNLISKLEGLKFEIDFDMHGQMVKLEHEYSVIESPNSYELEFEFKRPRSMIFINDFFRVSTGGSHIRIDYCRKAKSIMEFIPKPIPNKLERTFRYDLQNTQEEIFRMLMKDITKFFGEYNYVDETYEMLGNEDE